MLGAASPVRTLSELRIWLAGSDGLAASLAQVCDVDAPGSNPAPRDSVGNPQQPAFLLVEADAETERAWAYDLERLLRDCGDLGVSRLLWIGAAPLDSLWLDRCGHFERVFSMDRSHLPDLEAAGARMPSCLWPASAPTAARTAGMATRSSEVVWLGGWSRDWPDAWRERLASVLRGAGKRGLRIVPCGPMAEIPSELRRHVRPANRDESRAAILRDAKIVIAGDARIGSPTFAPPVLFEAIACGAAVLTPHEFANIHDFGAGKNRGPSWRNLAPVIADESGAVEEIDRLLDDDELREEIVSHLQRIVANNHTYQHRLATLSSAAGIRLTPDAIGPTPA